MAHIIDPRHCPDCGGALVKPLPGREEGAPYVCTQCARPYYLDPKLAVACVVQTHSGVVLLRRAQHDDAYNRWILPGGHVDRGEEVHAAAVREVAEETGLKVHLGSLLGVYSYPDNPVVLVAYAAEATGGRLRANAESLEMRPFGREEIPWHELGYVSTGDALKDFFARRQAGGPAMDAAGLRGSHGDLAAFTCK